MNRCVFVGRIVSDFDVREVKGRNGDTKRLRFRLGVRRPRGGDGEKAAMDFATMVAFGSRAEFITRNFKRNDYIWVCASFRSDEYTDRDGNKRRDEYFLVEEAGFCTPPANGGSGNAGSGEVATQDGGGNPLKEFMTGSEEGLPF